MLTAERLRIWPAAVLVALAAAVPLGAFVAERPGGDYPCFWAAGRLVLAGGSPYDAVALRQLEAPWLAGDGWLPFAYPPAVAALHASIAWLPYRVAWVVHTFLVAAAVAAIPAVLGPTMPRATVHRWLAVLGVFGYPMARAVAGGQGTGLLALALAASVRALHDGRPFLAGLLAGAALLKPTLGLPLAGLVVLAGGRHAAAGVGSAAAGVWLLSAAVRGPRWLGEWWAVARGFQAEAQAVEGARNVGLLGAAEHALGYGSPAALALGAAGSALVGIALLAIWLRPTSWAARAGATAALLPLIPPHSVWYDAGLAGIALLAVAEAGAAPAVLVALWTLGGVAVLAGTLGFQPLIPVLVLFAGLAARR